MKLLWKSLVEFLSRRSWKGLERSRPQRQGHELSNNLILNLERSVFYGQSPEDRRILFATFQRLDAAQKAAALRQSRLQAQGREMWKDFRRSMRSGPPFGPSPAARRKAIDAVRKLAPEASAVGRYSIVAPGIEADDRSVNRECCFHTFDLLDRGIPPLEQALTLYLWKKLFPERYRLRPLYPGWLGLP
jgi:hypothetical protein